MLKFALAISLCCTLITTVHAQEDNEAWEVHGYIKSYPISAKTSNSEASYLLQNALRLNLSRHFGDNVRFEAHYELMPFLEPSDHLSDASHRVNLAESYRIYDIESQIFPDEPSSQTLNVYQNLDRLNLRWSLPGGDLTVGRQAVTFGSARLISPSDVILPFSLQSLNQEYRPGVDAVRYQSPLGALGELDVGAVIGDEGDNANNVYFLRSKVYYAQTDITALLAQVRKGTLSSLGFERALWQFGSWLEVAHMKPPEEKGYFRASTGLDYAFTPELLAMIEYHYNGAGSSSRENYIDLLTEFAYQKGGVFLLGQNYLIPSLSWQIHPLVSVSGQGFINLSDDSSLWSSQVTYNHSENLYLDLGFFAPLGPSSDTGSLLEGTSEYSIYPRLVYTSARYYF